MILFAPPTQEKLQEQFPDYTFVFARVLDSTNLECQRRWHSQPEKRWLVLADEQQQGRGMQGRTWQSAQGVNVYLSLVWPNSFRHNIRHLNLFLGVVLWESLVASYGAMGEALTVKWPNDIYVGPKKLAGILIQNLDASLEYVVVGIGINVYAQFPQIPETAVSIRDVLPDSLGNAARVHILCELLRQLHSSRAWAWQQSPVELCERFSEACQWTRQHMYTYHTATSHPVSGFLQTLYADGTVEIRTESGQRVHLTN